MEQRIRTLAVAALIGMAASVPASAQVRLIFASQSNPASTVGQFFGAWAKRVTDASQGTGVVEIREGGTLANFQNVYERVLDDVVQIGFGQQALIAGKFPLTEVVVLPFIVKDNTIGSVALWRLYKTGLLDKEYDQVVPIWMNLLGPSYLHFNKTPPALNDLSGLKIRVTGKVNSQMVKRLGVRAGPLPAENMYTGCSAAPSTGSSPLGRPSRLITWRKFPLITCSHRSAWRRRCSSWQRRNMRACRPPCAPRSTPMAAKRKAAPPARLGGKTD